MGIKGVTMFEKEAKKWVEENTRIEHSASFGDIKVEPSAEKGFQKGAEFGYNKANEWHYPSKGEYPKECENVWCYCKGMGVKFCCVGHTIVGGDNKVRWVAVNTSRLEKLQVIAWKEFVLPELKESEENLK